MRRITVHNEPLGGLRYETYAEHDDGGVTLVYLVTEIASGMTTEEHRVFLTEDDLGTVYRGVNAE